jgi:hypothetical protein
MGDTTRRREQMKEYTAEEWNYIHDVEKAEEESK